MINAVYTACVTASGEPAIEGEAQVYLAGVKDDVMGSLRGLVPSALTPLHEQ